MGQSFMESLPPADPLFYTLLGVAALFTVVLMYYSFKN